MNTKWFLLCLFVLVALACVAVLWIRVLLRHAEAGSYVATFGMHLLFVLWLATSLSLFFGNFSRVLVAGIASMLLAEFLWIEFLRTSSAGRDAGDIAWNPLFPIVLLICPFACATNRERATRVALILSVIVPLGTGIAVIFNLPKGEGGGVALMLTIVMGFIAVPTGAIAIFITNLICKVFDYFHADRLRRDRITTLKTNIPNP